MKKPLICVHIVGETPQEIIRNLNKIQKKYNCIEIRFDKLKESSLETLKKIEKYTKTKSILTIRKKIDGGDYAGSEKTRIKLLLEALKLKFDFVDIEVETLNKNPKLFKNYHQKIIASYHNFSKTPTTKEIKKVFKPIEKLSPKIKKIAVMINQSSDLKILYNLLINKKKKEQYIIIGMGEKGTISRVITPLLGSYLTFAPVEKAVAPGQLQADKLKTIYNELNNI